MFSSTSCQLQETPPAATVDTQAAQAPLHLTEVLPHLLAFPATTKQDLCPSDPSAVLTLGSLALQRARNGGENYTNITNEIE